MISTDTLSPIAATAGLGFVGGYILAYFLRKIVRILMFVIGGILALLLYLQTQQIITINVTKLQTYTDGIFTSIANVTTTSQIPVLNTIEHLGIPLSSSVTAGFVLGITRR
jgi:uncharacterized membrane protein (Fun14 family)